MRNTKIICTIGPASDNEKTLKELMLAGMNVARFNFSHDNHQLQKEKLERVVKVREELELPVATLLDTKGPEIRLKEFATGKVELKEGQQFIITMDDVMGDETKVSVTYKNLNKDVKPGAKIMIDDGLIELKVNEVNGPEIVCTVLNGGFVSNKKGLNIPGSVLTMPYISETDRADILFGAREGFDFIAASFARTKEDILEIRALLDSENSRAKIIAKIENMQGIQNLDEILEVSDGIMVARGDMGVEIPMEEVPILQKKMIQKANECGKHVITATQMLESMIKNPRPTRAEATDIANAIYDGTTAIMLSGETANGKYPVEALKTMVRIAEYTEQNIDYRARMKKVAFDSDDITAAIAHASCDAALDLKAKAVVTVTMSGYTGEALAKYKPGCPIIVCATSEAVCRQANLLWGVQTLHLDAKESSEELFAAAIEEVKNAGYAAKGDIVVITAGVPLGIAGKTNMMRVVEVE